MIRDWVEDHFFQYVLLLIVIGVMLGVVGIYLISFILAAHDIFVSIFMTFGVGGVSG